MSFAARQALVAETRKTIDATPTTLERVATAEPAGATAPKTPSSNQKATARDQTENSRGDRWLRWGNQPYR